MRASAPDAGRMLRRYSRLNARPDGSGAKLTRGSGMSQLFSVLNAYDEGSPGR